MNIGYKEMLNLTWREFDYYSIGYFRRLERGWDYSRHLIASNYNSSGFSKKTLKATEVMELPLIDKKAKKVIKRLSKQRLDQMLKLI